MADKRHFIGAVGLVPERGTVAFSFIRGGRSVAAFITRIDGAFFAYVNECPHVGLPLDEGTGMFLNGARGHFLCIHHGALFEPKTGLCVRGPCDGDSLQALKIVQDHEGLWVEN